MKIILLILPLILGASLQAMQPDAGERQPRLIEAARSGNLELVKNLLERGAAVNQPNQYGYTPLHWAAIRGHQACCELLVNRMMKIPNAAQTKKICTFLLCIEQTGLPLELQMYYFKKHLLRIIEQENREVSDGSVALREINKIKKDAMKNALIAKFWPNEPKDPQ